MNTEESRPLAFRTNHFLANHGGAFFWCSLFLLITTALHFLFPPFVEGDVPYHAAVGRLIREHGILYAFPWTPFSWLADNYADDRLLFHLLYVPVAHLDWITSARVVGIVAGTTILVALYFVLRVERIPFAGLWALLPLACSVHFVSRFMLIRPHLLSIALAIVFLRAAMRGRLLVLAGVSFLYPLTYVAFWQMPLLLLIAAETARLLAGEPIRWKPAVVTAVGIAVGIVVHPNALNLVAYNWIVMVDVLFKSSWLEPAGFDMGSELNPLPWVGWIQSLSIGVLMTAAAIAYGWRERRRDTATLAFALAALGFCILTVRSSRFAEYFVPFSVAAFAFASRGFQWRRIAPALVSVSLVYTLLVGYRTFSSWTEWVNPMPPEIAAALQQRIPPGSQVFTLSWGNTGLLLLALPERYFIVALDPTLFYLKDPELYQLWYRIAHEQVPELAETIRRNFGARYVVVYNPSSVPSFNYRLSSEPGVRMLFNSQKWLLFDLGTPPPMQPTSEG